MLLGLREVQRTAPVRPMSVSAAAGYNVREFLAWEAFLLDHERYAEWTALLSTDLRYRGPAEMFAQLPDEGPSLTADSRPVRDHNFILVRVRELEGRLATRRAPDASVSVHRLITNVMVSPGDCSHEFAVVSYVLVTTTPQGKCGEKILTVERRDRLRCMSDSFQIARRELRLTRMPAEMGQWVKFL